MQTMLASCSMLFAIALVGCGSYQEVQPRPTPAVVTPSPKPIEPKGETAPPKPDASKAEAPKADAPKPAAAGTAQNVQFSAKGNDYSMSVPADWKRKEASNQFRAIEMTAPKQGADADDAELSGFVMPGGGGYKQNLQRWVGQMGGGAALKAEKTVKTAGGVEVKLAELEGTYTAMTMQGSGEPKSGYVMLGAFIATGNTEIYFKFSGPKQTVEANKAAFEKMIESFK